MILILALVSLVPIQKVEASVTLSAAVCFVCATVFSSMAINLVSNSDAQQKFADWFWGCCDKTQQAIRTAALQLPASLINNAGIMSGNCKITFDAESWSFICEDVRKYIYHAYHDVSQSIVPGSDGTLGFTTDSQFSCAVPGGTVQLVLTENCILTLDSASLVPALFAQLPHTSPSFLDLEGGYREKYGRGVSFSVVPFDLIFYDYAICAKNFQFMGSITSDITTYKANQISFTLDSSVDGAGKTSYKLLNVNGYTNKDTSMYTVNGEVCYFCQCTDYKYRFVPLSLFSSGKSSATDETCVPLINNFTGDTYYSFDNRFDMYYTVLDGAGLKHYTDANKNESETDVYTPYVPPFTNNMPDVYNGTQDVTLTIPETVTGVDDIPGVMEADVVTEYVDSTNKYPDGVPQIDSSGLFDKFPFCIPVDIYNLFVGFSADSAPPKFDIPFKYMQQDDGSYLIDYTITIDFEQLSDIAYISRWFIGIEFVLGLILITRKVIGAQ